MHWHVSVGFQHSAENLVSLPSSFLYTKCWRRHSSLTHAWVNISELLRTVYSAHGSELHWSLPLTWSVVLLLRTGLVLTVQRYEPVSLLRTSLMSRFHSLRYGLTMLNRPSSMTLRSSYVNGKEFWSSHATCNNRLLYRIIVVKSLLSLVLLLHCARKKVNHCIHFHNSGKQCQILVKFCNNNATSNCKQNTKFQ